MTWEKNIINIKIKTISILYENSEKLVLGVMTAVQSWPWKISTCSKIGNHTNPMLWRFVWLPTHILWNLFDYKFKPNVYLLSQKTSCLCLQGWYSWRGCQNLSILSVSKKYEWKTNKYALFSWFWALFVIKQWSRIVGSSAKPQV